MADYLDTDWRPSKCPVCGGRREAAAKPVCRNPKCQDTAIAALPAQGVRVKPTDAQVASACLSYRHDFGLLSDDERKTVMFQAREWLHAWQKELAALAPAEAGGVEAAKQRIAEVPFVDTYGDLPGDDAADDNITAGRIAPDPVDALVKAFDKIETAQRETGQEFPTAAWLEFRAALAAVRDLEAQKRELALDVLAPADAGGVEGLEAVTADLMAEQTPLDLGVSEAQWQGLYEATPAPVDALVKAADEARDDADGTQWDAGYAAGTRAAVAIIRGEKP